MSQTKAQLVGGVGFSTADSLTVHNGLAVTGVVTATSFDGNITGNITGNATGLTGTPGIEVGIITASSISAVSADFSGNVTIGGTLQYEDVTNIDAIGIVTARSGINITGAGMTVTGISTFRGDVQVADEIVHLDDSNTAIRFPAADTFTVETSGSERLRISSTGEINTTEDLQIGTTSSHTKELRFADSTRVDASSILVDNSNNSDLKITNDRSGASIVFATESAERSRLDSSGRLLLGATGARANFNNGTRTAYLQLEGTSGTNIDSSSIALIYNQDSTGNASNIYFGKTRGSSDGDNTALNATGDRLGNISFQGNDGTQFVDAAHIRAFTDGTPGADDMPARLVFSTNSGTTSPTERLRIDSGGRVIIGGTSNSGSSSVGSYGNAGLQLNSTTAALTNINLINRNGSGTTHALVFAKARDGGANGGRVQEDDDFGAISFQGFGGTGDANYRAGAEIRGASDGTPGSSDMPGRLEFWTCPDGTASMSERLRIDSRGSFQFSNGFMNETVNINTTARNGTQAVNLDDGMVHYFQSSSTGTWKPNFTMSSGNDINATIATGDTFSVTMIVNKGNTAHFANAIQVDGSDVTPDWSGGAPTDGGGNNTWDIYHYTIIKTGDDTFKCWASVSTYEP